MRRSFQGVLAAAVAAVVVVHSAVGAGEARASKPGDWRSGLRWIQPKGFGARDLDGKIIVVEFWALGCINCQRTIPAMRALHEKFGADVVVVGIHTPELEYERDATAVRRAVAGGRIRFAVAQDNDYRAWRAFDNQYWPAAYVLDRNGRVRHTHVGELHEGSPRWNELLHVIDDLRRESATRR